jgi:adenine-specific DNA-methyltransferase
MRKPTVQLHTTTLWDYPSQSYGAGAQGDQDYAGVTPSHVVWNSLRRWTRPKDLVVDPMAGSGTTLDVARDLGRRALGYDLKPARADVFRSDARKLPLEDGVADFVFVDPPYGDHVRYSWLPECLGELKAGSREYRDALARVIAEIHRVLRPGRYAALYICDSFQKGAPLKPLGLEAFGLLCARFVPVDAVAVVRRNAQLARRHFHTAAIEGDYMLRGFNYLFAVYKPAPNDKGVLPDRRQPEEVAADLAAAGGAGERKAPRDRGAQSSRPIERSRGRRRPR